MQGFLTRWMLVVAIAGAALGAVAVSARADGGVSDQVVITSVRSWGAPTNTRIVFDLSTTVTPVMPDSGITSLLMMSLPGTPIALADSVPAVLRVGDGVVDSVLVLADSTGARCFVWLADTTRFRCFALAPEDDKPFRIVVDVTRRGAMEAEAKRLADLAALKKRDRLRIVTIDAGHGGEDTGAKALRPNRGVFEKNVTLAVARALAQEINKIPGLKAVLTRDSDFFIPLRERYHIAERVKADLFVSIHCNSTKRRGSGSGTEVYFLSIKGANDQADADLADGENAADLVGGVPPQAEDDVVNILYDVKRADALQRSQLLAESLLEYIVADRKLEGRGVKQAGFVVLKSVEFPSVLVETAFINNPVEVKLLKDPAFQRNMAKQLSAGVKEYFRRAGITLGTTLAPSTQGL